VPTAPPTIGGYQVKGTPFRTGINDSKFFTAGGTGDYHIYDIDIFYRQAVKVTATISMFIPPPLW
jgi:hypothetical protein